MSRGIFDISNYAKLYRSDHEVGDAVRMLEFIKRFNPSMDDPELENLRMNAELAMRAYHNKLHTIVDDMENRITKEYLGKRTLF
jgi:hypothetical protein